METVRESFNESLSSIGSDDTVVPEQTRTLFVQQLKTGRDTMKKALESAYKAVAPYTSGQYYEKVGELSPAFDLFKSKTIPT